MTKHKHTISNLKFTPIISLLLTPILSKERKREKKLSFSDKIENKLTKNPLLFRDTKCFKDLFSKGLFREGGGFVVEGLFLFLRFVWNLNFRQNIQIGVLKN